MMRRRYWSTKADYRANCCVCGWFLYSKNAMGPAAKHHDKTGHTISVEIIHSIIYETEQSVIERLGEDGAKRILRGGG